MVGAATSTERRLIAVLDELSVGIALFDETGRYLDVNHEAERLIGRPLPDLLGHRNWEVFPDTNDGDWHRAFTRVARTGDPEHVTSYYPRWDRHYEASLSCTSRGIVCTFSDVTQRHQKVEQLTRDQQQLYSVIMDSPLSIALWEGPEHRCVMFNRAYETLTHGRARTGARLLDLFPELAGHPVIAHMDRVLATGEPEDHAEELILLRRDDGIQEPRWFATSWRAIRDEQGRPTGVAAVGSDVTELVRARTLAEEALVILEKANRVKDEVLAVVSHELRGPLAPILSAVDLLQQTIPEASRHLKRIERQVAQLRSVIDDLLDVERIARGSVEIQRTRVGLAAITETALDIVEPLVHSRRHHLRVHVPPDLHVEADERRLIQVLANLLTNAAKYSPTGADIEVRAFEAGPSIRIVITDTGPGIPEALLANVFTPFSRAHKGRRSSGLGLGLSIVRGLVELHGGTVTIANRSDSSGTLVTVSLPAYGAAPG